MRSGHGRLLFLEDDVVFVKEDHVQAALEELPDDWDLIYFGANILHTEPKPEPYSPHLCRILSGWTTHALGFNKKCISFILENLPGESEQMYDNWLSGNLVRLNSYIVTPMAAYQRPGQSLIWNSTTNYEAAFTSGDIILNHICKRT